MTTRSKRGRNTEKMDSELNSVNRYKSKLRLNDEDAVSETPNLYMRIIKEYNDKGELLGNFEPTQIPIVLINPIMHFQLQPLEIPLYESFKANNYVVTEFIPKWKTMSINATIKFDENVAAANLHTIINLEYLNVSITVDNVEYKLGVTKNKTKVEENSQICKKLTATEKTEHATKITKRYYTLDEYFKILTPRGFDFIGPDYLFEIVRVLLSIYQGPLDKQDEIKIELTVPANNQDNSLSESKTLLEYISLNNFNAELLYNLVRFSLIQDLLSKTKRKTFMDDKQAKITFSAEPKIFGVQEEEMVTDNKESIEIETVQVKLEDGTEQKEVVIPKKVKKGTKKAKATLQTSQTIQASQAKTYNAPKSVLQAVKTQVKTQVKNQNSRTSQVEVLEQKKSPIVDLDKDEMTFTGIIHQETLNFIINQQLSRTKQIIEGLSANLEKTYSDSVYYEVSLRLDTLFEKEITLKDPNLKEDSPIVKDLIKLENLYNSINKLIPSFKTMTLCTGGGKRRGRKQKLRKVKKYVKVKKSKKSSRK